MIVLFVFLFYWQARLERSGYFGEIYQEAIANIEINRHNTEIDANWDRGKYFEELLFTNITRAQEWQKNNKKPSAGDHNLWTEAAELDEEADSPRFTDDVREIERSTDPRLTRWGTPPPGLGNLGSSWGMNRRPSSWPPTAKEPAKQADFAAKFKTFEA